MKQLHLRVSDSFAEQLDAIKRATDAPSVAGVLRDAVCLYSWVLAQIENDREIISVSRTDHTKQVEFSSPGLHMAKAKTAVNT